MKTLTKLSPIILLAGTYLATASTSWGEDPTLLASWNFNDVSGVPASQFAPSSGTGSFQTNWETFNNFAGSSLNLVEGDVAGRDLALVNGTSAEPTLNAGNWFQFNVSTLGFENLVVTYAGRTTGTGLRTLAWSYSVDGDSFTHFTTVDHVELFGSANYGLVTLDLSSITAMNNQSQISLRGTLSALEGQTAPTAAGNTRFDNVQFTATAIPEPSTYAALLGVVVLGAVALRRRRK